MAVLKLNANADIEGLLVPALPYIRRIEFAAGIAFDYDQADGDGPTSIPVGNLTSLQAYVIRSSQAITVTVDGQTHALNAGGILIACDVTASAITTTNASGETAHIDGAVLGS